MRFLGITSFVESAGARGRKLRRWQSHIEIVACKASSLCIMMQKVADFGRDRFKRQAPCRRQ
jgi:hypothetical protein